MTERLTYFCDRSTGACHLYAWAAANEASESLYQVYCRAALDDSVLGCAGGRGDPAAVREAVAAAGGGLIAETRQSGLRTTLTIQTVAGKGHDPATELLVLSPGKEPEQVPFNDRGIDLEPGAFVLLPASRTDQSNLLAFVDHLRRLPGDYRGLLLNVLRRPGIEAAMGRLEQRLDRLDRTLTPTAEATAAARPGAARSNDFWTWLLAGLLVLNLLGVAGAAIWVRAALDTAVSEPAAAGATTATLPRPGLLDLQPGAGSQAPYRFDAIPHPLPWWLERSCPPEGQGQNGGSPTTARPAHPADGTPAAVKPGRGS